MKSIYLKIAACGLIFGSTAYAGDVVAVVSATAAAPTKAQIGDIFLGKSESFTPIDLPDSSPIYADFYKKATGRDPAQVKATWARIVFSGKGKAPKQLADAAAVKKAIAADPKTIGYIDSSAVDASVKAISLD